MPPLIGCFTTVGSNENTSRKGFNAKKIGLHDISSNLKVYKSERGISSKAVSRTLSPKNETESLVTASPTNQNINFLEGFDKSQNMLPPIKPTYNFTLILELNEMLVHYEPDSRGGGRLHARPNVREFLKKMSEVFEIVVFSTASKSYCDFIIDQIDSGRWIKHRLC